MSRIGRMPIPIPTNVKVDLSDHVVRVKGPKGELMRPYHAAMQVEVTDGTLTVSRPSDSTTHRALHGLTRSLINNMVEGVTKGFQRVLDISGVGYRAVKQGDRLILTVGYSHPVEITPPAGVSFAVEGTNRIIVSGIDKEAIGEVAARIRGIRPPEPYKGKGIRYSGERIRRKAGKAGAKKK